MCTFSKHSFSLLVYFWLGWVFAALRAFLWLRRVGATLWLRCVGFSLQGLLWLGSRGRRACQLQQPWLRSSAVVAPGLWSTSSGLASHQLTCSKACGICPVQESDSCLLNSQVDSLPLHHLQSPHSIPFSTVWGKKLPRCMHY